MWDLIVSVPDHCLSFYLLYTLVLMISSPRDHQMSFTIGRGFAEV